MARGAQSKILEVLTNISVPNHLRSCESGICKHKTVLSIVRMSQLYDI